MYEDLKNVERKFSILHFPLNIAVEPSNYCNLNCIMCAHDKLTRAKGIMDIVLYKKIIDEIAEENPHTRLWLDFYGEPLLQKFRLFYMIDYARKKGMTNIALNTNAMLLNQEMTEMLLDSGIEFISFDCDGMSKKVYEEIRVGADRDQVYHNITFFLKRKKERNLNRPIAEVKIMEMEQNKHELQAVVDYWRAQGAWTCVRRLISWGGSVEIGHSCIPVVNRIACGNAVGIMPITWNGSVPLCVMDVDAKYAVGDVTKESIKEIWKRRNEGLVRTHMEHRWDELPHLCTDCKDWMIMGENRYDENGNPVLKNYETDGTMLQEVY